MIKHLIQVSKLMHLKTPWFFPGKKNNKKKRKIRKDKKKKPKDT